MSKVEESKWLVSEKERTYEALTSYDNSASYQPNTRVIINMEHYRPKAKPADFDRTDGHGSCCTFLARVTSLDGMCHMTFNIMVTPSAQYFEIEFYDIVNITYGGPKFQKIYENTDPYLKLKLQYLPTTVEKFVEILLTWFEELEPLLFKYRQGRRSAMAKEKEELKELEESAE